MPFTYDSFEVSEHTSSPTSTRKWLISVFDTPMDDNEHKKWMQEAMAMVGCSTWISFFLITLNVL